MLQANPSRRAALGVSSRPLPGDTVISAPLAELTDADRASLLGVLSDLGGSTSVDAALDCWLSGLLGAVDAKAGCLAVRYAGTTHSATRGKAPVDAGPLLDLAASGGRAPGAKIVSVGKLGALALPGGTGTPPILQALIALGAPLMELALRRNGSSAPAAAAATEGPGREALQNEYPAIIGESPALIEVLLTLDKVVASDIPVLIRGESGTGKELVARAIHDHGARHKRPYVSENCAALTETLLESELFGHVKGAFTGASGNKKGLFEVADGGTLFLDEVGDMSLGLQKKVLRALQEGEIRPVGGKSIKKVDVRIISATNRPLEEMIAEGGFREDLYYRLNVVKLQLPPLRERAGDLPRLIEHFIEKVAKKNKMEPKQIAPETMALLVAHNWPGNVRELENEVNRMLFMGDDPITPDALSDVIRG